MIVNAFSAAVAGSEYSVTKTEHTSKETEPKSHYIRGAEADTGFNQVGSRAEFETQN
jgi:hypothetical protein